MRNLEVARLLNRIADLLEIKGELVFKIRAYREAARQLETLGTPIEDLWRQGKLRQLPGFGQAMEAKIAEYLATGRLDYLDRLADQIPSSLADLMGIPGLGPKTIAKLHQSLGITDLDQLERAALEGRLRSLPALGERSESKILAGIRQMRSHQGRTPLPTALALARQYMDWLHQRLGDLELVCEAGSLRRRQATIGDIDILAAHGHPEALMHSFCTAPTVTDVLQRGPAKSRVRDNSGLELDLRAVPVETWGAALQYFTGSHSHNVRLRTMAVHKGLSISEYGIFAADASRLAAATEEQIYATMGMDWIPPEIRENSGEIEAALEHRLPHLVELRSVKGDLHVHTDWSDGRASLQAMAEAARSRGYSYLCITDHSPSLAVARGLDADRLHRQAEAIRDLNSRLGGPFKVLAGAEVDIRRDGSLDLPDDVLAGLDFVIASVHSHLSQPRAEATERLIRAMRNPHVDLIGHPTGRKLGGRDGLDLDLEQVLKEAAATGTGLEINSQPDRLDLDDVAARRAVQLGVRLAVNTDAHGQSQLDHMSLGIEFARRAWLEAGDILNCGAVTQLAKPTGAHI